MCLIYEHICVCEWEHTHAPVNVDPENNLKF